MVFSNFNLEGVMSEESYRKNFVYLGLYYFRNHTKMNWHADLFGILSNIPMDIRYNMNKNK